MTPKDEREANRILKEWRADLREMDRSIKHVKENFGILFHNLFEANIPPEMVESIFDDAVRAHFPPKTVIDNTYKNHFSSKYLSKHEFLKQWEEAIELDAIEVRKEYYPMDELTGVEPPKTQFGQMSRKEYSAQRKYADSFRELDPNSIQHVAEDIADIEEMIDDNTD